MMNEEKTKSFAVSKQMVYDSYLKVCDKNGGAGIDKETIDKFNEDLSGNLYKVWNRMASGSYFPPAVRTVLIPKKQGGTRPLGIPTVGDRIAQGVVKDYLEPVLEPLFHESSFGYRPGRSAHDALAQCNGNCIQHAWVVDLDIKGFFDNISHEWMMKMVQHHTQEKWVLLYIERWLKAGIQQADGSIAARTKGTPQGGVISPLLANLYLHHAFDMWMRRHFAGNPFERYADDIIVHCDSKAEAEHMLESIRERLAGFELELHSEKTKLVYCKCWKRKEKHKHNSFTFLSYSFQPRAKMNTFGRHDKFTVFNAAICCKAKAFVREKIRGIFNPRNTQVSLEEVAKKMNPKIRGWLNYYCRFNPGIASNVFLYLNGLIRRWIEEKFRLKSKKDIMLKYQSIVQSDNGLFVHWQKGVKS
jgi:group II intron reverse transcriptase/maturase